MLAQRLNTLEADLQLLLAMQDLYLQGETNFMDGYSDIVPPKQNAARCPHPPPREIPERDVSKVKRKEKNRDKPPTIGISFKENLSHCVREDGASNSSFDNVGEFNDTDNARNKEGPCPSSNVLVLPQELESLANRLTQDFNKEKVTLQKSIEDEKRLRSEVEETAKKVYVQLQKVEDDLARERQTKESLLIGTLKLKNLVQGFNTKIRETDKELQESKAQVQRLKKELQTASSDNASLLNNLEKICEELGYHKEYGGSLQAKRYLYVEFLRNKFQELIKKSIGKEHDEVQKLASQLNNVVGRCAKLEKERDDSLKQLEEHMRSEDTLKKQLHKAELSLSSLESDLLKNQFEYDCIVQKLQSELQIEKQHTTLRISEYSSVIQRSKCLLVSLKEERDTYHKNVRQLSSANQGLECRLNVVEKEKQTLLLEFEQLKRRMGEAVKDKTKLYEKSQQDILKLEMNVKTAESEKRRCMQILNDMKNQLLSLRNKCDHELAMQNVEKERLKNENTRLDENFRVLQKVSEDQGHTIQKLRGELDTFKEASFKLESQLRDKEITENQLINRLEQSEKQSDKYVRHIDQLEEKIERYAEDLKQHDCDEYTDSKYKQKLVELDSCFRVKSKELEEALKKIEAEKNEAVSTAKRAIQKIEEIKDTHQNQLKQVKSACQSEVNRLLEQNRKTDAEKMNKIVNLQSELDRTKLCSSQTQRALSTKIQQLQAALTICLGTGSNQNNNSSLGLLQHQQQSLNQFQHFPHQQDQMHCIPSTGAFGNGIVGALGNNGFANSNVSSNNAACINANVGVNGANLLLNTGGSTSGHQTTCFGNSNVNECTSGVVVNGEMYPKAGMNNVDLGFDFGNNFI